MTAPTAEPETPPKKGRGRWFKARVVLAALVLLIGFTLYFNWRNTLPPTELEHLASGTVYLDVPLMTLFTFPRLDVAGFYVSTNVSFAPSSVFTFAWANVSGVSLPVRWAFEGSGLFQNASSGAFTFSPSGSSVGSGPDAIRPGIAGVMVSRWALDYTVRLMSQHDWLTDDQWVEVGYSLRVWGWSVLNLPAANVTSPSPTDLLPVTPAVQFRYDPGFAWSYAASVRNEPLPQTLFTHRLPPLTLSAGDHGTLSAALVSTFRWSPGDAYTLRMGASDGANVTLRLSLDTRFGALVPEFLG